VILDAASLIVRIALVAIFCTQGYFKTFGPADRPHGREASERLIASTGWPAARLLAMLLGLSELVFGALVGLGVATRLMAVPLAGIVLLAIGAFKRQQGFVGGWDWPFAVLALALAAIVLGGGAVSIDSLLGWSI
jgi:putative oxidoreductase